MSVLGNALGNSIVDKTTAGDSAAARRAKYASSDNDTVTTAGVLSDSERALLQSIGDEGDAAMQRNLDAFTQQGLAELTNRPMPSVDIAQPLSSNPRNAIRSGSNTSPDRQATQSAAFANVARGGNGAYYQGNALVIPITHGANELPPQGASYGSASWTQGACLAGPIPAANYDLGPLSLTVNGTLNAVNSVANGLLNGIGTITEPFDRYQGELMSIESGVPGLGGAAMAGTMMLGRVSSAIRTGRAINSELNVANDVRNFGEIKTPWGSATQSASTEALAARSTVENGATLYRLGTIGKSEAAEAQFWALEHPFSPGYADRYGIPAENVAKFNFIETATLKPGTPFVTRPAPGIGSNSGGGIEVVVPMNGVTMKYFGQR